MKKTKMSTRITINGKPGSWRFKDIYYPDGDDDFELFCSSCDNFPGDNLGNRPGIYGEDECTCPFKKKFENGELNGNTMYKEIGCTCFWD